LAIHVNDWDHTLTIEFILHSNWHSLAQITVDYRTKFSLRVRES